LLIFFLVVTYISYLSTVLISLLFFFFFFFFFQAEDGIRDGHVTEVQTCALPISRRRCHSSIQDRRPRAAQLGGPASHHDRRDGGRESPAGPRILHVRTGGGGRPRREAARVSDCEHRHRAQQAGPRAWRLRWTCSRAR